MDKFIVKVLKTIDKYNMISADDTILAAVSGGYDSLCMLYVLKEICKIRGCALAVMHLNHSFRAEADSDAQFVKETCEKLSIPFHLKKVDVLKYAQDNGISFETAGRIIRYEFFNEVASGYKNTKIATAHNANDSVESFFMHLLRGSGLTGLTGISPKRDNIIRPLIEITREEIENYCNSNNIVPVIDITNDSDDYARNDIRHNVMPHILNRCSVDSLLRTMDIIREDDEFCEKTVKSVEKEVVVNYNGKLAVKVKEFNILSLAEKRRILYNIFKEYDRQISLVHIDSIISLAEANRGGSVCQVPGDITIKIEKGMLEIYE